METIYSHTYEQGIDTISLADFYSEENAVRTCPSDCVVTAREVAYEYAELNCEEHN